MSVSVITPVYNAPELAAQYAYAVRGAEVVIVDNASEPDAALIWERTAHDLGGRYIRNDDNRWYATACNQGYAVSTGDVVCFINNDIMKRGEWLPELERAQAGALYGPATNMRVLSAQPLIYLDAWWIAARRETWEQLREPAHYNYKAVNGARVMQQVASAFGPWDGDAFQGMYWDDVDLCFRAARLGIALRTMALPLAHLSNYTSSRTPGAYAKTDSNGGNGAHRAICEERVRMWQEAHDA